jgi:hypothetical protein
MNKEENKMNETTKMIGTMFGGMLGIGIIYFMGMGMGLGMKERGIRGVDFPEKARPATIATYDVNRDGLEDIIPHEGEVMIRQTDGSLVSLSELKGKDIDAVIKKYTFKPEEIRNTTDNLDYNINTGKYLMGQ